MRQTNFVSASADTRTGWFGVRRLVIGLVVAVAALWGGVAFAQEAYLSHKLNQQMAGLRSQNAVLGAQNDAYRKDVKAISSGSADEEEARRNGFARSNERLYLVTVAPSPTPAPSPSPGRGSTASPSSSPRSH